MCGGSVGVEVPPQVHVKHTGCVARLRANRGTRATMKVHSGGLVCFHLILTSVNRLSSARMMLVATASMPPQVTLAFGVSRRVLQKVATEREIYNGRSQKTSAASTRHRWCSTTTWRAERGTRSSEMVEQLRRARSGHCA